MFDKLEPRSPTPLYAQIAMRIRLAVAAGELKPNDSLPSVRQLAARLRVNPATVVQAYRELETDGFLELRQGAGTYVREVAAERRSDERAEGATKLVRTMLADTARLGIATKEIVKALERELGVKIS